MSGDAAVAVDYHLSPDRKKMRNNMQHIQRERESLIDGTQHER